MKYYAVRVGKQPGIYETWEDCKSQVHRYPGAEYKSFSTRKKAEEWIEKGNKEEEDFYSQRSPSKRLGEIRVIAKEKAIHPPFAESVINVYTDGACSNNGRHDARAGIGVYFGEDDPRNFSGAVFGKQTNNTAEVKAIIKAFKILEKEIKDGDRVNIYSDSRYAIRAAGEYGEKQEKAGWKNDIPNKKLVKKIYNLFKGRDNVKFIYVKGHSGDEGNDGADELARLGAELSTDEEDED